MPDEVVTQAKRMLSPENLDRLLTFLKVRKSDESSEEGAKGALSSRGLLSEPIKVDVGPNLGTHTRTSVAEIKHKTL